MLRNKNNKNEKGIALLFAVILSLVLIVLGLGLTMFSITNFTIGTENESHQAAFTVADAGYNLMKDALRGQDLTVILSSYTAVPEYINLTEAINGTIPQRNPLYPLDARNIDFRNPPDPVGVLSIPGLMTPVSGISLGTGYFFARISDNSDGDGDLDADFDNTIYMRVTGVHPGPLSEISSHGGHVKNSVSIIESLLKRDFSFDMGAPLSIAGPDVDATFDGAAFNITGDDDHPGISVFYDDMVGIGASATAQSVYEAASFNKNQGRRITGDTGDFGPRPEPSIRDDTDAIKNSPNPDARNVLDPNFLASFVRQLSGAADSNYSGGTSLAGTNIELGTAEHPEITFVEGDLTVSGSGEGFGVLIVTGSLEYLGSFDFNGLVLVLGEGEIRMGGATKDITGGMLVSKLLASEDGGYEMGVPSITLSGNSNFMFDSESIRMAVSLLPMKSIMWREITPDLEPTVLAGLQTGE